MPITCSGHGDHGSERSDAGVDYCAHRTTSHAFPDGRHAGPNSGGKSTIIESLNALSSRRPTFSEGKRNKDASNRVSIRITSDGGTHELRTVESGGSETIRDPLDAALNCYVLPSRRFFNPYFGHGAVGRDSYLANLGFPTTRSQTLDQFSQRLFEARQHKEQFNEVLEKVMNPVPDWTIEQSDQGNYYISVATGKYNHSSDGLGDGVVSMLFLVDALYDSSPGDLIVVDEPELSLHPVYQQRVLRLFADYAKNRQIVYATHSPYFVDFEYVLNGAAVARVYKHGSASRIRQLNDATMERIRVIKGDLHNPHVLGLNARETFFQDDGVIVLEGQEDVLYYGQVLNQLAKCSFLSDEDTSKLKECFFGWGAGGATKIDIILSILKDLGFGKVAAVFDSNEKCRIPAIQKKFPGFCISAIPADDVRTKAGRPAKSEIHGLLDDGKNIRPEFLEDTKALFKEIATLIL